MARARSGPDFIDLPGSYRALSRGAKVGPPIPADEVFSVLVRLHRSRPLGLLTGKTRPQMSHSDYAAKHSAKLADINQVKSFAERFHLEVDAVFPVERSIILKGTAKNLSKAFRVKLRTHRLPDGKSYRGREGKISIPSNLASIVMGVFGLDDRPVVHRHVRFGPLTKVASAPTGQQFQTPGSIKAFYANQLAVLYHFPEGTDGSGQNIGIVEIGGGFKQTDLDEYFADAGITNPPNFAVATVPGGASNSPDPTDPELPDLEVLLDMEVAGSAAPGANFRMFFGKDGSTKQSMLAVQAAVHYQAASLSVLSLSWGGEEYESSHGVAEQSASEKQYQDNMNDLFETAATLGITVCVSTGDNASACFPLNDPRNPWDGHAHVNFPASSPYVLAVGGTHIVSTGAKVQEETWHPAANVGTGGGISRYFSRPGYQQNDVSQSAVNPPGGTGRGVPDVSADAAQQSGYIVKVDGHSYPGSGPQYPPIGGTSAAAPLWAALIARLNQGLNTKLGFVNPLLYKAQLAAGAFRDITKGNNGDYKAGPGWDPCTGLGVPNGDDLLKALSPLVVPAASSAVEIRAAASKAGKALRSRGKIERPTPEQISGQVSHWITQYDSDDPTTYFPGTVATATVSTSRAPSPIQWPKGKAPVAAPLSAAPDPEAPLSKYDYLVVTWTTEEAKALADILTPDYPSKTAWYHYTRNFTSEYVPIIKPDAPSVKDSHRLGSFFPTVIAGKKVLCFKSELHLNQDGPKLPILKLWKQLIAEVRPKLILTTGTGGGIGSYVELGDVTVASSVRFDCTQKLKAESFAKSVYRCSNHFRWRSRCSRRTALSFLLRAGCQPSSPRRVLVLPARTSSRPTSLPMTTFLTDMACRGWALCAMRAMQLSDWSLSR
jgi:kumamolisin